MTSKPFLLEYRWTSSHKPPTVLLGLIELSEKAQRGLEIKNAYRLTRDGLTQANPVLQDLYEIELELGARFSVRPLVYAINKRILYSAYKATYWEMLPFYLERRKIVSTFK